MKVKIISHQNPVAFEQEINKFLDSWYVVNIEFKMGVNNTYVAFVTYREKVVMKAEAKTDLWGSKHKGKK